MRGDDLDPCALDILGHVFGSFLSSAHAESTARTAPIGPVCCKAAKTVPKPAVVDFVGDFRFRQPAFAAVLGSQLGLRRSSMQPARRRRAADRIVLRFDYGWPADAARPRRPVPYRRWGNFAGSPLSAGTKIFCSTCRCTGFLTIGT